MTVQRCCLNAPAAGPVPSFWALTHHPIPQKVRCYIPVSVHRSGCGGCIQAFLLFPLAPSFHATLLLEIRAHTTSRRVHKHPDSFPLSRVATCVLVEGVTQMCPENLLPARVFQLQPAKLRERNSKALKDLQPHLSGVVNPFMTAFPWHRHPPQPPVHLFPSSTMRMDRTLRCSMVRKLPCSKEEEKTTLARKSVAPHIHSSAATLTSCSFTITKINGKRSQMPCAQECWFV